METGKPKLAHKINKNKICRIKFVFLYIWCQTLIASWRLNNATVISLRGSKIAHIILAERHNCNFLILTSAFLSRKLIYCFSKDLITNTTKQLQLWAEKAWTFIKESPQLSRTLDFIGVHRAENGFCAGHYLLIGQSLLLLLWHSDWHE